MIILFALLLVVSATTDTRKQEVGEYCTATNPSTIAAGDKLRNAVCTANDVRISQIVYVAGPTSCTIGQNVLLTMNVQWQCTSQSRYDVSAYIAMGLFLFFILSFIPNRKVI